MTSAYVTGCNIYYHSSSISLGRGCVNACRVTVRRMLQCIEMTDYVLLSLSLRWQWFVLLVLVVRVRSTEGVVVGKGQGPTLAYYGSIRMDLPPPALQVNSSVTVHVSLEGMVNQTRSSQGEYAFTRPCPTLTLLESPRLEFPPELEVHSSDPVPVSLLALPSCRICLESTNSTDNRLVSNCGHCKGSQQYIHTNCRQRWIVMHPDKALECETCRQSLVVPTLIPTPIPFASTDNLQRHHHVVVVAPSRTVVTRLRPHSHQPAVLPWWNDWRVLIWVMPVLFMSGLFVFVTIYLVRKHKWH